MSRFVTLTKADIDELVAKKDSQRTHKASDSALKIFSSTFERIIKRLSVKTYNDIPNELTTLTRSLLGNLLFTL